MPQRTISFDDSALPRSWHPVAMMPGSFDEDWLFPIKIRRAPTPWAKLAPLDETQDDDGDEIARVDRYEAMWTLPPSQLGSFANINVTLDDIAAHALGPQTRPSRASMRSVSVSSTSSLDSISTLLSDLDESIASWQSCSDASASSTASGRSLKRRRTPRIQSLRDIRTKQSEMQLKRVYEDSTQSYLDDSIYGSFTPPPLRPRNPARLSARYSQHECPTGWPL